MRTLDIASTGMMAQQTNVEVIANNLANMNTTGYKNSAPSSRIFFTRTSNRRVRRHPIPAPSCHRVSSSAPVCAPPPSRAS